MGTWWLLPCTTIKPQILTTTGNLTTMVHLVPQECMCKHLGAAAVALGQGRILHVTRSSNTH